MRQNNQLPASLQYSQLEFSSLSQAESFGMTGVNCLTPYISKTGIKQYIVQVDGYGGDSFLDLDTANLFLGTTTGSDATNYPYKSETAGEVGSVPLALPLKFSRIHFLANQGKTGITEEYYTYVLSGPPIKVNPATGVDVCLSDSDEELYGIARKWGSTYEEPTSLYPQRVVIGGGSSGPTGYIVTGVEIIESGCQVFARTKRGIGYVLGDGDIIDQAITYRSGELQCLINNMVYFIDDRIEQFSENIIQPMLDCACDMLDGTPVDFSSLSGISGALSGLAQCLCDVSTTLSTYVPPDDTWIPELCSATVSCYATGYSPGP